MVRLIRSIALFAVLLRFYYEILFTNKVSSKEPIEFSIFDNYSERLCSDKIIFYYFILLVK